jgi:5'-3' exonuclease
VDRVYLLDASVFIFKSYFTMPDHWHSEEGFSLNAVYGYSRGLIQWLKQEKPVYMMAAFDESLFSGFRHELYSGYKNNRALPDEALAFQLDACKQITEDLGIVTKASNEFEADDLIASAAKLVKENDKQLTVLSNDKDLGQLIVDDGDELVDYSGKGRLDREAIRNHFGVESTRLGDYLALAGDSVDGIPGVKGVGKKTAASLLQAFDSIDEIYKNIESVPELPIRGAKSLQQKLIEEKDKLQIYRKLTYLRDDALPEFTRLEDLEMKTANSTTLEELGLNKLVNQIEKLNG